MIEVVKELKTLRICSGPTVTLICLVLAVAVKTTSRYFKALCPSKQLCGIAASGCCNECRCSEGVSCKIPALTHSDQLASSCL